MPLRLLLSLGVFAAVTAGPFTGAAAAECRNALAGDATSYAQWQIPGKSIETLRDVYRRISGVTNMVPHLVLCPSDAPNAAYVYQAHAVLVTTRLLLEFGDKPSQLAAVIGHEFAHGELEHDVRRTAAGLEILRDERRSAEAQLLGGGDVRTIVARALNEMKEFMAGVQRDLETEADERGMGIAVNARYDADGAKAALSRLAEIEGHGGSDQFSDHPETQQRIADVSQLALNEHYRAAAENDVAANRPLKSTLIGWRKDVPGSGALAFYDGVDRLQSRRPFAPEAFGDAVANFRGDGGISYVAQVHQEEAQSATLALCTSLYEAGQSVTALHCVKRLSDEDRRRFDEWAQPKSVLITDRRNAESLGGLYSGRNAHTGVVKITNCSSEAARDDLRPIELWRPSHLQQVRGTDSLDACDASLCNCRRLDASFSGELQRAER